MTQHQRTRSSESPACPLFRHDRDKHNGDKQNYTTGIIAAEAKIVRLYSLEAVLIEKQNTEISMNERNKRGRGGMVRITAARVTH